MELLEQFFIASLLVQLAHSTEELTTKFHKKWYLVKMPLRAFLLFELAFSGFWIFILFNKSFPSREYFQLFFLILMFANGIQHVVWFGVAKKYVPGLITAPVHIIIFSIFYFIALFNP